jgi:hypothetical protein
LKTLSKLFFTLFISLTFISTTLYAEEDENALDVFQTAIESSAGDSSTIEGTGIISDLIANTSGGYTATVTSTQTGTVNTSNDKVFSEFSGEVKSWFSGSLGYLIALFAFTGTVIIYAFTHRHGVLFIGFLISFLAGAGPTLAGLSHSMGAAMSGPIPGGCGNTAIGGIILKGNLCYKVTRKEGSTCLGQIVNPSSCGVVSSDGTITYSTSQQVAVSADAVTATIESLTANLGGEEDINTLDSSYSSLTEESEQLRRLQTLTALADATTDSSYDISSDDTYQIMNNLDNLNDSSFAQLMSAMNDDSADWDTTLTNVAVQARSSKISMGDASDAFNEKISSVEDNNEKMKVLEAVEELYNDNSGIDATLASDYISVADSITTSADFSNDTNVQNAIVSARTTNLTTTNSIDKTKLESATSSASTYEEKKEILDIAQNMSSSDVLELSNNADQQEVIYSIVNHDSFTEQHAEVLNNIISGNTGDYNTNDAYTNFETLITTNTDSDSGTADIDIATLFETGALFEVEETEEEEE